jgi:ribonuclease HII
MSGYEFDARFQPTQSLPLDLPFYLAGADEAGRGPLAGPVVAAAVILPPLPQIYGLRDSKIVPEEQRDALYCEIQETALAYAVVEISHADIDQINILQASLKAMRMALLQLQVKPNLVLIDGNKKAGSGFQEMAIIDGDAQSACIMAASILAKVTRDHIMREEHEKYPQYGFDEHKGYGAPSHLAALKKYGPCPIHRKSFAPVRAALSPQENGGEICPTTTNYLVASGKSGPGNF